MMNRLSSLIVLSAFLLAGCASQVPDMGMETEPQQEPESNMSERKQMQDQTSEEVTQLRQENQQLKTQLERQQQHVQQLKERNQDIVNEFRQKLDEVSVSQKEGQVVLNLQEKILFDVGSVTVKEQGKQALKQIASVLKKHPEREVLVEGHTDDIPINTERYPSNWELSSQRALNVLKFLVYSEGVSKDRIGAVAYGQFRPLVPNTSPENRAKNRRVEIVLLPKKMEMKSLQPEM